MNYQNREAVVTRSSLAKYFGFVLPIVAIVSGVALRYGSTKTLPEPLTVPVLRGAPTKKGAAESEFGERTDKLVNASKGADDRDQGRAVISRMRPNKTRARDQQNTNEPLLGSSSPSDDAGRAMGKGAGGDSAVNILHPEGSQDQRISMEEDAELQEAESPPGETRGLQSAHQAETEPKPLLTRFKKTFGWVHQRRFRYTILAVLIVILIIMFIMMFVKVFTTRSIQEGDIVLRPGDVVPALEQPGATPDKVLPDLEQPGASPDEVLPDLEQPGASPDEVLRKPEFVNPYAGLTTDSEFNCVDYDPNLKDDLVRKSDRISVYETAVGYLRNFQPSSGPIPVTIHKPFLDYLTFRFICFGERLRVNDNTFEAFLAATPGAREYLNSLE